MHNAIVFSITFLPENSQISKKTKKNRIPKDMLIIAYY